METKTILVNKKAKFNYTLIETFTAGLVLEGWMVKAIRQGKLNCSDGAYVYPIKGKMILNGIHINAGSTVYRGVGIKEVNENPEITLLLNKKEIQKMIGGQSIKGYTIVFNELFWQGNLIKARISLAKGKNNQDKRETIKERDNKRELDRVVKSVNKG